MSPFARLLDQKALPAHKHKIAVISPVSGRVQTLDTSSEPFHQQRMFGEGAWIEVSGYQVVAPFAGTVTEFCATSYRIRMKNKQGLKLQIQCGVGTHNHYGEGFKRHVKVGQKVQPGESLFDFDLRKLRLFATECYFAVTLLNSDKVKGIVLNPRKVSAGEDEVFSVII